MNTSLVFVTLAGTILCQRIDPAGPWRPQPGTGGWPATPGGHGGYPGDFGGRGGGGRGPFPYGVPIPPFAENLLPPQQDEFLRIVTNMNLKISEQKRQVMDWANRNGVQPDVKRFNDRMDKLKNEVKQGVTQLIANLTEAQKKLFDLLENEKQTPVQLYKAIQNLTKENPPLYHVLMFANDQIMMQLHRTRKGGPHGPGGSVRPVRPGGPGAPMPPYAPPSRPGVMPGGGMWGQGGGLRPGNMGGYGGGGNMFPF